MRRGLVKRESNGYKPLHFAVAEGNKEVVTLILSKGAYVDAKAADNITPLHIAAEEADYRIAAELLDYGACINSLTLKEEYTPLHFACESPENGNTETVKLFLNRGADINLSTKGNLTPLHIAIEKNRAQIVRLLLQHGVEINNLDKEGKTILNLAVEAGNLKIVEDVLKYFPDINNESNRISFKNAIQCQEGEYKLIVKALLDYGFTISPEDASNPKLLFVAVEQVYLKVAEDLLNYGADVNILHNPLGEEGLRPLHFAVKYRQEEAAKLLISYGAAVNGKTTIGKTPIFFAINNKDLKITELLISNKAKVKNPELLIIAVMKGCKEIVETLLQHDVRINARDQHGRSVLHFTTLSEESEIEDLNYMNIKGEIAELLLSKGANVNAQANDGATTLHYATKMGYAKVVEVLLKYNANVNCKIVRNRITPLHLAVDNGNMQIIEMLLIFGADINSTDEFDRTALQYACQNGLNAEVVGTLLDYGSGIYLTCISMHKALDYIMTRYRSFSRRNPDAYIRPAKKILEVFKRYIVKMKTANLLDISESYNRKLNNINKEDYQDKCEKEIVRMKAEKINNTKISFYDILVKDISSLASCLCNENIVQVLKTDDYQTKFP
ncbi:putative ankyrin repeat protein RF_0381, partial [Chrysoperla carnea]|uniref:putative ankyrin repeat protein RF_0381 n=1 Tax=Chrysoperla carnea TaxID=189513 RepID=UPI001D05DCDC